uniref:40S ribosomal protein S7 n=1 Tax=Oryza sativa subsp. japonica TaxID=39947 RepID=Q6Z6T1_ORYSJ|nr:putative ribosomal protein S7 [Oryza sativa Japonica Group]BAD15964.1 putative ribosomal protein S7 [Oryza sativa Japonica Group]
MDVAANWKVVVIHVLYHLCKAFKKIHVRLVKELEKKFSGKDVVFDATRRIVRPLNKGSAVHHPRTRTLITVHDGILEDERNNIEYKLETFFAVYRRLCGKDVAFEYPVNESA